MVVHDQLCIKSYWFNQTSISAIVSAHLLYTSKLVFCSDAENPHINNERHKTCGKIPRFFYTAIRVNNPGTDSKLSITVPSLLCEPAQYLSYNTEFADPVNGTFCGFVIATSSVLASVIGSGHVAVDRLSVSALWANVSCLCSVDLSTIALSWPVAGNGVDSDGVAAGVLVVVSGAHLDGCLWWLV